MDRKLKRTLTKIVIAKVSELKSGNLDRKQKRAATKELMDALRQLKAAIDLNPEAATENEKLRKLQAGDYDSLSPADFIKILREIVDEINDIEQVKIPAVKYIDKRVKKA